MDYQRAVARACLAISKMMLSSDRGASAIFSTPASTISSLKSFIGHQSATETPRTSPIWASRPGRTSMPVKWPKARRPAEFVERFRQGFRDHIFAALQSQGLCRLADLGRLRAQAAMSLPGENTSRLGLRSFRAKFVLVVGSAVLFDLLVTGGLALWNVQELSATRAAEVGRGL